VFLCVQTEWDWFKNCPFHSTASDVPSGQRARILPSSHEVYQYRPPSEQLYVRNCPNSTGNTIFGIRKRPNVQHAPLQVGTLFSPAQLGEALLELLEDRLSSRQAPDCEVLLALPPRLLEGLQKGALGGESDPHDVGGSDRLDFLGGGHIDDADASACWLDDSKELPIGAELDLQALSSGRGKNMSQE
jgi:hypothetical protein